MTGAERFLAGCRREDVDATPVWFMRQSGGSLPGYRKLRERHDVMHIARTPELSAEVTLEAADRLGTDGAVLFADVMLAAQAMGVELELAPTGPVIARPIRSATDVLGLRTIDAEADLGFVAEAIRLTRAGIGPRAAVIGIAGGPFTVAAYHIEGGPSRDQLVAKRLMFGSPQVWFALVDRIADATVEYVRSQVSAGAQAVQLFDSWAGSLAPLDYDTFVAPWARRILKAIRAAGVPAIHFAASGAALLERLAKDADVVGVDAGQSLRTARERLPACAVQGNLDPARLAGGPRAVTAGVERVLEEAGNAVGHVFNTGHAVPRDTDPGILAGIVDLVHERTTRAPTELATVNGPAPVRRR